MPSQKQEFSYPGQTSEQLLVFAYGAFLELGWTPKYAGPLAIIGYTTRSWNKYDDEIIVEATDEKMSVKSSLVHNESFDMIGKNKKHIKDFMEAFEKVRSSAPKPEWTTAIENLRTQTVQTVTEEAKQAEEINKVMKLSGSNLYATYAIIGINVLVFILMAINGAEVFTVTNGLVHIKWGSNVTALTLSGDWWRLITSMFIHFGIIHLAMNMYALYTAGVYLESMLGKAKYITAYFCTGIIAGIISLWWHKEGLNGAGASGAIFGLYGVFLALLLTNLIPKQVRTALLQSIGIFVVFNIVYGMRSGIDNAAHIGGLSSGMLIGFIFYLELSGKLNIKKSLATVLITILTIACTWYFLNNYKSDTVRVDQLQKEFFVLQDSALNSLVESEKLIGAERKEKLLNVTLPIWKKNLENLNEMESLSMSTPMKTEQQGIKKYVQLRIEETELLIKAADTTAGAYDNEIEEIRKKINDAVKKND
ncbi:MAG TPA: rhomboid family intramembrane serine protease [Chitinophagaceae bacterium]|nr:rhomboid family intramembrane serine protease [Chitinophagaceae bacterium]